LILKLGTNNFSKNLKIPLMNKIYILLAVMVSALGTYGQSGVLDTSFGNNGIVTTVISGMYNLAHTSVVQPDGKIIVAGEAGEGTTYNVAVARYNADGTLDSSFGNSGTLLVPVGSARSYARNIAIQPDGKIVIGAYTYDDIASDFAVVRLNGDGSLDNSFGTEGITIVDNGSHEVVDAMTILNDGKILLAGYNYDNFLAARFNTDGTLDTSFGTNGWATTVFDSSYSQVKDATSQNDGKILLSGFASDISTGRHKIAVARFNTDGTIDNTFGTSGQVSFNIGSFDDYGAGVAVQTDGKIMIGGYTILDSNFSEYDFAAVRLNSDGTFDDSYGTNGIVVTSVIDNGRNYAEQMLLQPDDKIVLMGFVGSGSNDDDMGMVRFDTEGNLDTTFGAGGKVITDVGGRYDYGKAIAIQPDNKIILAGYSYTNTGVAEIVVARYDNFILGVNEYQNNELRLYPNPAKEQITIEISNAPSTYEVNIFDSMGKKVFSSEIQQQGQMDVSALATGTYLIKLYSENRSNVIRFVKE
jgi:uncharacterized delta-60 repeat protein